MAKNFDIEIREAYDKKYLKVFISDLEKFEEIKIILDSLEAVKKVNITESKSKNSPPKNLTVYPMRLYDIKELKKIVENKLENYFKGRPNDPILIEENLSSISERHTDK